MATIHQTTLVPGKLDLVAGWIVDQPWYVPHDGPPRLSKAGGFRLDDPAGEVGIEFMVVWDEDGSDSTSTGTRYHVPVTYRGSPLDGADDALIGTSEHGVLGRRWTYDGTRDPVLLATLIAFVSGDLAAQAQSESDTLDPTVHALLDGPQATPDGLEFVRVLTTDTDTTGTRGQVSATWLTVDGTRPRGPLVLVR